MIVLKNKEYKFKFGFKAILNYENETGKKVSDLADGLSMQTVVDLCFYAIKAAGDKITKDEIIDAIDDDMTLISTISDMISTDMAAMNVLQEEAKK
jgi:hypothetical protein